jgi:Flp pilus assembly protein TadB
MLSNPLVISFLFVTSVFLFVYYFKIAGRDRANEESTRRITDILDLEGLENPDEIEVQTDGKRKTPKAIDDIANRIARSQTAQSDDAKTFLSELDHRLVLAGLRDRMTPEQAIASALSIWAVGIIVPLLAFLSGFNTLICIIIMVYALLYPVLKLKSLINKRQASINSDIPFFINDILMSLSSSNITINQAILRATKTAALDREEAILAHEFAIAHMQYTAGGVNQETAFREIAWRCGTESVSNLTEALAQGATEGSSNLRKILEEYSTQAQEMWNQDMREYKNKKDTLFTLGVVMTMFGGVIIYMTPLIVEISQTFQQVGS